MASPGNQHYANCIGTLSYPIRYLNMRAVDILKLAAREQQ